MPPPSLGPGWMLSCPWFMVGVLDETFGLVEDEAWFSASVRRAGERVRNPPRGRMPEYVPTASSCLPSGNNKTK